MTVTVSPQGAVDREVIVLQSEAASIDTRVLSSDTSLTSRVAAAESTQVSAASSLSSRIAAEESGRLSALVSADTRFSGSLASTQKTLMLMGTSRFAGGVTNDDYTGVRRTIMQEILKTGLNRRYVGPKGLGAPKGSGTIQNDVAQRSARTYFDPTYPPSLAWQEHCGLNGRQISNSVPVTGVNTSTDRLTVGAGSLLGNGVIVVLRSTGTIPVIANLQDYYFIVSFEEGGQDFQLSRYEGGSAENLTDVGSGTITVETGLAEVAAVLLPQLLPDHMIVEMGANDILQGASLATMQSRAQLLFDNITEGNPNCELVMVVSSPLVYDTTPHQTVAGEFNDWLASHVPTLGSPFLFADAADGVSKTMMASDLIHPRRQGNALWGKQIAEAYIATQEVNARVAVPRAVVKRDKQACLTFTADTDLVTIADQAVARIGSDNVAVFLDVNFTSFVSGAYVLTYNLGVDVGLAILQSADGDADHGQLRAYFMLGSPQIPAGPSTGNLLTNQWYRLALVVDGVAGMISLFANGRLLQSCIFTHASTVNNHGWYIGGPTGSLPAALMRFKRLAISIGAHVTYAASRQLVWRDYYDDARPDETIEYPFDEGSGASAASHLAGANAGTITGGAWAAAGTYPDPHEDNALGNVVDSPVADLADLVSRLRVMGISV